MLKKRAKKIVIYDIVCEPWPDPLILYGKCICESTRIKAPTPVFIKIKTQDIGCNYLCKYCFWNFMHPRNAFSRGKVLNRFLNLNVFEISRNLPWNSTTFSKFLGLEEFYMITMFAPRTPLQVNIYHLENHKEKAKYRDPRS